jgi:hypothetical protein
MLRLPGVLTIGRNVNGVTITDQELRLQELQTQLVFTTSNA